MCMVLAIVLGLTPLGSLAHLEPVGEGFVPDLCTAERAAAPTNPAGPVSHPASHAHCGDCSTCGVQFAPRAPLGAPTLVVAAIALDAAAVVTPSRSVAGGVAARPRGPPLLA